MYFLDEETRRLTTIIKRESQRITREQLDALLKAAAKQATPGLASTSNAIAARYSGDQVAIVKAALARRYPDGWQQMPVSPVGWVRFWASQDSGCYHDDAVRYLEDPAGERIEDDAFAAALKAAKIEETMPEVERRCMSGAASAVVMCGWRKVTETPALQIYWPHDVAIVCHPEGFDDPAYLLAVALRQSVVDEKGGAVWWVWSRDSDTADDGTIVFGDWYQAKIGERSGDVVLAERYEGTVLPVAFFRTRPSEGSFFPPADPTVPDLSDSLNVARCNELHVVDKQAHAVPVVGSDTYDGKDLPLSPDRILALRTGDTFQYVTAGADIAGMQSSREMNLREVAVTRGTAAGAYTASVGVAESGVSRMIANIPQERRLRENRAAFTAAEEQQLLPIIVDVVNSFGSGPDIVGNPRVKLADPISYEEPEAKQRRLVVDMDMGVISKATYAVEMGHYRTIEDAVAAGLSNDLRGAAAVLDASPEMDDVDVTATAVVAE